MNHGEVIQRLPWLLSGSLDEPERETIRAHLATCEECRAELARTSYGGLLFAAEHPTSGDLVDAVWGRLDPERAAEIATHVGGCPTCREEWRMARASREDEAAEEMRPVASPTGRRRGWLAAVAAGVILAAFGTMVASLRSAGEERRVLQEEVEALRRSTEATLEASERAEQRARALESQIAQLPPPRSGVPVLELLPVDVLRGGPRDAIASVDRDGSSFVLLALALEDPLGHPTFGARLLGGDGQEILVAPPAAADDTGALTLLLPTASLPVGIATVEVTAGESGAVVGRYRLSIRGGAGEPKRTNEAQ